jgi:hypothetical protein
MRKGYLRPAAAIVRNPLLEGVPLLAVGSPNPDLNQQCTEGVRPVIAKFRNGSGINPAAQFVHIHDRQPADFAAYSESKGAL